jgi:hypothetical protein
VNGYIGRQRGAQGGVDLIGDQRAHGAGRRGGGHHHVHPVGSHRDVVDQAEIDDVHPGLGIDHPTQHLAQAVGARQQTRVSIHES